MRRPTVLTAALLTALTITAATVPGTAFAGGPAVSGDPVVGNLLTAESPDKGTWEWSTCAGVSSDCVAVSTPNGKATSTTYTVQASDVDRYLRVTLTVQDKKNQIVSSAVVGPVAAPASAPAYVSGAAVTGTAEVGGILTAAPGTWSGSPEPTLAYQWGRCSTTDPATCVDLPGASGSTYTVVAEDAGAYFAATVTATNTAGSASTTVVHDTTVAPVIVEPPAEEPPAEEPPAEEPPAEEPPAEEPPAREPPAEEPPAEEPPAEEPPAEEPAAQEPPAEEPFAGDATPEASLEGSAPKPAPAVSPEGTIAVRPEPEPEPEPIEAPVLQSPRRKVGEPITLVVDPSLPVREITWLRCDDLEASTCEPLPVAATAYTPTAADAGRYLTASLVLDGSAGEISLTTTPVGPISPQPALNIEPLSSVNDRTLLVAGTAFSPGSEVQLTLYSDPLPLGTLSVRDDGSFMATVTIPADITGEHTLEVVGLAMDGGPETVRMPVAFSGETRPAADAPAPATASAPQGAPVPTERSVPVPDAGAVLAAAQEPAILPRTGASLALLAWTGLLAVLGGAALLRRVRARD